ncbi:MAG TPA: hypothetical protein VJP02_11005 [Candidatus Sulfotelmatobacter sp.]|nr:hypothetical protein [Candidatus Sulfotelmatobacter sp.]
MPMKYVKRRPGRHEQGILLPRVRVTRRVFRIWNHFLYNVGIDSRILMPIENLDQVLWDLVGTALTNDRA